MWQIDWRWCQKCWALFFSNGQPGAGRCPAGGQHEKAHQRQLHLRHNQVGFVASKIGDGATNATVFPADSPPPDVALPEGSTRKV